MGWRRVAEQELPTLAPETRQYLQAYADGVNAYIKKAESPEKMSLEYTVLARRNPGYRVEPWTPVDSLAWLKAHGVGPARRLQRRAGPGPPVAHARARSSRSNLLYPPYPVDRNQPILSEQDWQPASAQSDQAASPAPAALTALRSCETGGAAVDSALASVDAVPVEPRPRRRHRLQLVGRLGLRARRRASRCSPTTRTSPCRSPASGARSTSSAAR